MVKKKKKKKKICLNPKTGIVINEEILEAVPLSQEQDEDTVTTVS